MTMGEAEAHTRTGFEEPGTGGAGPYRVMPRSEIVDRDLRLRAVEPGDIERIRLWRNAQMDVLRQSAPISDSDQIRYFAATVWPDKNSETPSNILLSIERDGTLIGYGGLVHIVWAYRHAEMSFLLDPAIEADRSVRDALFLQFLRLMQELAFEDLRLNRLHTETYATRTTHIALLEKGGMIREGRLREHVVIDGRGVDALVHGLLAADWVRNG